MNPLYNNYAVDRRTLAQTDPLDRRNVSPLVIFGQRTFGQPDSLDRRLAPQDCLERRTISLSDGSVRSYFALPPDPPPSTRAHVLNHLPVPRPQLISLSQPSLNLAAQSKSNGVRDGSGNRKGEKDGEKSGVGPSGLKRKNGDQEAHISKREKTGNEDKQKEEEEEKTEKDKGKAPLEVDKKALLAAFLKFSKLINDDSSQKKNYLSNSKHSPLRCLVCARDSKDFKDVKALVTHSYYSMKLLTEHRGLHKALCVLIGWDPHADPNSNKWYMQVLSDERAQANRDDLVLWPPIVVIQNTNSNNIKDGKIEGMGNKEIDSKLLDLGFVGGKAKNLYGKEGHQGVTLVKFSDTPAGLKEADRLSEFFQKTGQGRKNWEENKNEKTKLEDISDKNNDLVKGYGSGEKRVLYGYLAIASDLEVFDFDVKKKAFVKSRKESFVE